ncbi:MAG: InlB B-repeat-containing protein, partial [Raoultibacter sp.]
MLFWNGTTTVNGLTFNLNSSRYDFAYDMPGLSEGELPIAVEYWETTGGGKADPELWYHDRIEGTTKNHQVLTTEYGAGGLKVYFDAGAGPDDNNATYKINEVTAYVIQKTYTVSYSANAPEGVTEVANIPAPETYVWKDPVTVSSAIPTCEGYTFIGWTYEGGMLIAGNTFAMMQKDIELQAEWLPDDQAIKYLSNNWDWGTVSRGGEAASKSEPLLGSTAIAKEGNTFIGWYTEIDAAGHGVGAPVTTNADLVPNNTPEDRPASVYYAVFEPIPVDKTALVVSADDSEGLVYNSAYQVWHEWTLSEGALKAGDTMDVTFSPDSKIKDAAVGESVLVPNSVANVISSAKVMRNGVDVTEEYDITLLPGELTLAKASAKIHAPSARKYYDGTPLDCYALIAGIPPQDGGFDGSSFLPKSGTFKTGLWTEGLYPIDFEFVKESAGIIRQPDTKGAITNVFDSPEDAVTDWTHGPLREINRNYEVEYVTGLLEILPRPITITANTMPDPIPYDGESHVLKGYTVSGMGLVEGETLDPESDSVSISGTQQGEYILDPSGVGFKVWTKEQVNSTGNYAFEYVKGSMTITAPAQLPEITLQAKSDTVTYNGSEQKVEGLVSNTFEHEGVTYTVEADVSARGTDFVADGYETELTGDVVVRDQNGKEVKNKFDITIEPGKLTIERRAVTVQASDDSKDYDGKALEALKYETLAGATSNAGLVDGHKLDAQVAGSQTLPGSSPSSVVANSVAITDASGKSVTNNYTVKTANGTLTVRHTAQSLVITVEA